MYDVEMLKLCFTCMHVCEIRPYIFKGHCIYMRHLAQLQVYLDTLSVNLILKRLISNAGSCKCASGSLLWVKYWRFRYPWFLPIFVDLEGWFLLQLYQLRHCLAVMHDPWNLWRAHCMARCTQKLAPSAKVREYMHIVSTRGPMDYRS